MSMGKILVADDDQNIAELLRLYLEKEGYTVVLAADGEQAIERFSAENPDIVLLDICLLYTSVVSNFAPKVMVIS